jgi:pimeloyl-ACP methyl ester carboxylesterase
MERFAGRMPMGSGSKAKLVPVLVAAVALSSVAALTPAAAGAQAEATLPIVFVHGFSGSGAQYETQALRWASNDYPNVVTAIDRTSTTPAVIYPILDAFFDDLMAMTGDDQVYVVGHSAGTAVMNGYLSNAPARAARVAKYIGIDGATAAACPGGVECMGIWARGNPARALGPNNVQFPDQGHTESVGSAESFAAQYHFFTGADPATTDVVPEPADEVEIAGRALNFPANTGIDGSVVQVWEIDPATGVRVASAPQAEFAVGPDGNFGPTPVDGDKRYELTVIRQGSDGPSTQHFYYEPWTRSNSLIRLNLSPLGSPLSTAIERGPHSTVSIVRQKEWWGNNTVDASNVDALYIGTTSAALPSQAPLNIINGATTPFAASTIAVIAFDIDVDGVSDVSQLQSLGAFLSGVDVYMPGTDPPDGTVSFVHHQRRTSATQVINTPNWSSEARHGMTVTFRDWVQVAPEPDTELSQRINVSLAADAGALVVSVDPNDRIVELSPLGLSANGERWESSGELRPVRVTDSRVTRPGWNVSGQVGPFISDIDDFGPQHLGWSPTITSQAPGQAAMAGDVVAPSDIPGQGLVISRTLASAPAGAGRGTAQLGAGLDLSLPVHLGEPGTYSALLTLTAI